MAVKVGELYGELKLKHGSFDSALGKAGGAFKNLAKVGIMAAAAIAAALIGVGIEAVKHAEEQETALRMVKTAYGEAAKAVNAWAEKSAFSLGVQDDKLQLSMAKYGIWARNVGQSTVEATKNGEAMATRAAEIAAATNKDYDTVFAALMKGTQGATKGLKQFGVAVDPVVIKQRALEMGLYSGTGALDVNAAALARQSLILEQTSRYTSAAADAHETLGFKMKQAGVVIDQIFDTIGLAIMPIILLVLDSLLPAFEGISQWVTAHSDEIRGTMTGVFQAVGAVISFLVQNVLPLLVAGFQWIVTNVIPALQSAFTQVGTDSAPLLGQALDFISTTVLPALQTAFDIITTQVIPAVGAVIDWLTTNILPPLSSIFDTLTTVILPALLTMFQGIQEWLSANWPTISKIISQVADRVAAAFDVIAEVIRIVSPMLIKVGEVILPIIGGAATGLLDVISQSFDAIGVVFADFMAGIKVVQGVVDTVAKAIQAAFDLLGRGIGAVWDGITGSIKGAVNLIIGVVNGFIRGINAIQIHIPEIGVGPVHSPAFDWNGVGLGELPYMHAGGIVPGNFGADVPIMAQAGERVVPAGGAGAASVTFGNIYVSGVNDPEAVARAILQPLRREITRQGMSLA